MSSKDPSTPDDSDPPVDPKQMSFEQSIEELESIIERIEAGEVGLEESLHQWKRGQALIRRCRDVLDAAEQQVQQLLAEDMEDRPQQ